MKAIEMVEFGNALELMELLLKDRTVPKNIKFAIQRSKNALIDSGEPVVKISKAVQILDEITNDPNMPMYVRTKIWNIVSILEEKRRELDKF